jgi:hypothetical protein
MLRGRKLAFVGRTGSIILSWLGKIVPALDKGARMSSSFRQALLGFDPLQEHALSRADAWTNSKDWELLACDQIVDTPPKFRMAEQELRDLVRATQDVTRDVGGGAGLKRGVARAGCW